MRSLKFLSVVGKNSSIMQFDMSHNSLDPDAAKSIAQCFRMNSKITSVDLSYNSIAIESGQI